MTSEEFRDFFSNYSKNVDNANRQAFWRFSDTLILEIIKKHIAHLNSEQTVLDAGGGTGRWEITLAKEYDSHFIVYDLSEDMLARARENLEKTGLSSRVNLVHGDLEDMGQIQDTSADVIISIYNPISFAASPEKAFREMYRVLKEGGMIFVMGQGYYNAIASKVNNYQTSSKELSDMAANHTVRWNAYVPMLKVFSRETLESNLINAGFSVLKTYGVPVFAQPGGEDFDPENSLRSRISTLLEDEKYFKALFEIEMKYNSLPEIANRGMNILSVGTK